MFQIKAETVKYYFFYVSFKEKLEKIPKITIFCNVRKFEFNFEISNLRKNLEISYIITFY